LTEWLLDHGAHKSLSIRNDLGSTPLDMARIFGPYPIIEAKLGAAMLDHQFGTQFAIRRGSLLRKQAGGAIEPEDSGGGDVPLPDESRPAEPTFGETITHSSESMTTGSTKIEESAVGTHTSPLMATSSMATSGNTRTATIDFSTGADLGVALTALSSAVEARFDEQAARLAATQAKSERIVEARFDEQAERMDATQAKNERIIEARFDEQEARFDEQASQLGALQTENAQLRVQNTQIIAKLDMLIGEATMCNNNGSPNPYSGGAR